jgi:hypothetical protein
MAFEIPLEVEDSGLKEVDKAVMELISTRPAPHPSGYTATTAQEDMAVPYMTPQVSNAIVKLKDMGPGIFPALVKHLTDDRYSYSDIVACWENRTVGDAVLDVLSDGHYMVSGYKFRKTPSGSATYLSFKDYLYARDPEKWASWASTRTRLDIQLDIIDWCISKEHERGFTDEAQRKKVLANYDRARKDAVGRYSETISAAKDRQPGRSATNRTPAAAVSRRSP